MDHARECPACGERDDLQGRTTSGGIVVECGACGHEWARGDRQCRSCGGGETVSIPQVITRSSRGNQMSIMGHRDITLCPRCDADVIATCRTARQWVPEGYVSAFSFEQVDGEPPLATGGSAAIPPRRSEPDRQESPSREPQIAAVTSRPPTPAKVPTVRQAVQEYMGFDPAADALAMIALGARLGSSTPLDKLGPRSEPRALSAWFNDTWHERDDRRIAAATAIRRVFGFWVSRGWLEQDPTDGLEG